MSAVIGEVTQQSGKFICTGADGKVHELKVGDKIHQGDKVVSQGGEKLLVALENDENIALDQHSSLTFDASVIGAELFSKEDTTLDETVLDKILEGAEVDADAVKETAAGSSSGDTYISGATAIDRIGENGDAKAETSELESTDAQAGERSTSTVNPLSFVDALSNGQSGPAGYTFSDTAGETPASDFGATGTGGSGTLVLTGDRGDYTITENQDGSITITDNRPDAAGDTVTVTDVENFQFNDQTLSAADLVDSNAVQNSAAQAALQDAAQAIADANNANSDAASSLDAALNSQTTADLSDPLSLQNAENSSNTAISTAQAAVDQATAAVVQAETAVSAAQTALDSALAAGESTEAEIAQLEASQTLLDGANDALLLANETLSSAVQTAAAVEALTIEPTVDPGTTSLLSENTPTLEGRAEAGSSVTISIDDAAVATVVADEQGNWSYQTSPLGEGDHTLLLSSQDQAGNSAESAPVTLTIDSVANTPTLDITVTSAEQISSQNTPEGHTHETYHYDYTLAIDASLTDSNETLSALTLLLPEGVELLDAQGEVIDAQNDGTYLLDMQDEAFTNVTVRSEDPLTAEELSTVEGSVTSTNSSGLTSTASTQALLATDIPADGPHHSSDQHEEGDDESGDDRHSHEHEIGHHQNEDEHHTHEHQNGQGDHPYAELDFSRLQQIIQGQELQGNGDEGSPASELNLHDLLGSDDTQSSHLFSTETEGSSQNTSADNFYSGDSSGHCDRNLYHGTSEAEALNVDTTHFIDSI